jgi:hypothetical protein
MQVRINPFLPLWINTFRSSLPFSPRNPRTRVTVRVPVPNPVKEDHVVNITSHHRTFSSRTPSWILGSTSKRPTRPPAIFLPRSGRGTKQPQRLPGDVLICLLACQAPAHIDGHTAPVTQASWQTDLVTGRPRTGRTPPPVFCRESRCRGNCFIPRFLPKRTGLGHLISASP